MRCKQRRAFVKNAKQEKHFKTKNNLSKKQKQDHLRKKKPKENI